MLLNLMSYAIVAAIGLHVANDIPSSIIEAITVIAIAIGYFKRQVYEQQGVKATMNDRRVTGKISLQLTSC
jgi:hypothetical protein